MLYSMIDWLDILGLAAIATVLWFWFDSLKARERAIEEARTACIAESLQLLDETVGIHRLALRRDDNGRLGLTRTYHFEFSTTGNDRASGAIVMRGDQVLLTHLDVAELPTRLIGE